MSRMYESFKIGNVEIKNRLVASAMFEYGANNGAITERIIEHYDNLSNGGVGLIITGMQAIRKGGSTAPLMVNIQNDFYVTNLKKIVKSAHDNGSKFFVQLQHCGIKTYPAEGYDNISVSDATDAYGRECHAATKEEIKEIVKDYGVAAKKCQEAGADGVQIHGAHGYLVNTFLSPSTNHRTDEYGGEIRNRARLLFEIYDEIRNSVGEDYPVGVKFPFSDLNDASITEEESLWTCEELVKKGIDMIEVSSGMVMDGSESSFNPAIKGNDNAPFKVNADLLAKKVNVLVISVCGYRTPELVEKTLNETSITAVSFGRPLLCEPELPNRWKTDDSEAFCKSCNGCCNSLTDGIITCKIKK